MGLNQIGYGPRTLAQSTVPIALTSGQTYMIPSGQYCIIPGLYTFFQVYDPVTTLWRVAHQTAQSAPVTVSSDGNNYRLANLTGTMVGASVTTAGTGMTDGIYYPAGYPVLGNPNAVVQAGTAAAPSVTMSAASGTILAKCNLIVGGVNGTAPTITAGGASYTRKPVLVISPPPAGGVPMTAYVATITSGAVAAVTVSNQGAGYTSIPTITVVNAPGDTTGSGCVITGGALTGSGGITAMTVVDNGATMSSVPTFTFSPVTGSPAATAIMCFTITTMVAQTGQDHSTTGNMPMIASAIATAQSINTNPAITTGLFTPRLAYGGANVTAGGGITPIDGGLHQIIPIGLFYLVQSDGTIPGANTKVPQTVGGAAPDISYLLPL